MLSIISINFFNCPKSAIPCLTISGSIGLLLGQMDELVVIDEQGHVHSVCLHWDGLPRRLWELLSAAGYPQPPLYDGHDFKEDGVAVAA